tara:strand:+ start:44 stop:187 length:144 start_codon:yes stop_codon:yes gene_type:complete
MSSLLREPYKLMVLMYLLSMLLLAQEPVALLELLMGVLVAEVVLVEC